MTRLQPFLARLQTSDQEVRRAFRRWSKLGRTAKLYLIHAALLTSGLAVSALFFNLAIIALGYPLSFLGDLNMLSFGVAALVSLPLWWLVTRIGLRQALLASALLHTISSCLLAFWPTMSGLMLMAGLNGIAAVLFQVSAPPLMMRYSDSETRDYLFSANTAINIGFAGISKLLAGGLPAQFGQFFGVAPESPLAYRATFIAAGVGLALSIIPLMLVREPKTIPAGSSPGEVMHQQPDRGAELLKHPNDEGKKRYHLDYWLHRLPKPWHNLVLNPIPLIQLLIPPFCISWGAALLIIYLNLFFKERFALGDATLGIIFALLDVGTGSAALIVPLIAARLGKIRTIVITQAISIPFLLLLGFVPLLWVAVGAALLRAMLFNMGSPLYDAFAMERSEEAARPLVIGLINGAYTAGYLLAPAISTRVQEHYGFAPLFLATAACYTVAVLANYLFFVRKTRLA